MRHVDLDRRQFLAAGLAVGLLPALSLAAGALERREIPGRVESLPVVGLGTARSFDVPVEDGAALEPLREVLSTLLQGGGRLVDSSPMYGSAEAVVGALARELPASGELFLATKVWTRGRQEGITQMRRSLELLGAERLDLMQIHNLVDWRTHLATLRAWQEQGIFRYLGISHYLVDAYPEVLRVLRDEPLDFLQINYSLLTPEAEREVLPLARERGVAVIVNRPFENGALFAAVRGHPVPPWAVEAGMPSWGQFFLKYILAHPAVTCVIPATRNPGHMLDNLQAGTGPLPDERLRQRMRQAVYAL